MTARVRTTDTDGIEVSMTQNLGLIGEVIKQLVGGGVSEKLTLVEAGEFLECSIPRVLELLRTGILPGIKPGQSWVIPRVAFFEAVNRNAATVAAGLRGEGQLGASMVETQQAADSLRAAMDALPSSRPGRKRRGRSG